MSRLFRFVRLPHGDRKILMKAVVLLWAVRIGLWILPFQRLQYLLNNKTHNSVDMSKREAALVRKITHSVKRMSRYVPAATCLAQALVTVALLEQAGFTAHLRIGVARSKEGKLEAHAWVESEGQVIIGGSHADVSRYTMLQTVHET